MPQYGTINFTMHKTAQNSEFVLSRSVTPKARIVQHMVEEWELTQIGLCLRVTGSVEEEQLASIEGVLQGIVHGVSSSSATSPSSSRYGMCEIWGR